MLCSTFLVRLMSFHCSKNMMKAIISSILLLMASNTITTALTTSSTVLIVRVYTVSPSFVTRCHPSSPACTIALKPSLNPPAMARSTVCHTSAGSNDISKNDNASNCGLLSLMSPVPVPAAAELAVKRDAPGVSAFPKPPGSRTPAVLLELSTLMDANRLPPACGPAAFSPIGVSP